MTSYEGFLRRTAVPQVLGNWLQVQPNLGDLVGHIWLHLDGVLEPSVLKAKGYF